MDAAEQGESFLAMAARSPTVAAALSLGGAVAALLRASSATATARSSREQRWVSSRRRQWLHPQGGATAAPRWSSVLDFFLILSFYAKVFHEIFVKDFSILARKVFCIIFL